MELNNSKINGIEKAIVETIAFFDLFDYPMTAWEIWKYCGVRCEFLEVVKTLEKKSHLVASEATKWLDSEDGFCFLKRRNGIIKIRKDRYNYTNKKFKRAIWVTRIFKFIPWIKMIAIGNIIGAHNLKKESDIDLFIITEKRRIWITRLFCVLVTKLLGLRPKEGCEKNKICLSFFVSEEGMDLEKLMLGNNTPPTPSLGGAISIDIYFIYWLAGLAPIFETDDMYRKFMKANNWLSKYLPNWQPGEINYRRDAGKSLSRFYHDSVDLFIGGLEDSVRKVQLKVMPAELKNIMNKDTRVVVSNKVLKLHAKDRRGEYRKKYTENISNNVKKDISEIIKEFASRLPKFPDGRIDYSNSDSAPVLMVFVKYKDKVLLLRRSDKVRVYKGKWNGIGGYLDELKSVKEKVLEELTEETGINSEIVSVIKIADYYKYFDSSVNKTWYINSALVELKKEPEIKLDWEHTEYKWVEQRDITNYDVVSGLDVSLKKVL
ncbi:MAG: NUDIX domain-containing protein [Patescibacteria group bacterium]